MKFVSDSLPYQQGVEHGPYLPLDESEAQIICDRRMGTNISSSTETVQQEHQLLLHADRIFWAWRQKHISDLAHYWLKENWNDAINTLPRKGSQF